MKPATVTVRSRAVSSTVGIRIEQDAQDGKKWYADSDARMTGLPIPFKGSDYVLAANADRAYSAVDLIELAVEGGTTVTLAYDKRLPVPAWLSTSSSLRNRP